MANEHRAFGTQINVERRAFAPLNIQNQRHGQTRQPIKPLQANVNSHVGPHEGQENCVAFYEKNPFASKISNNNIHDINPKSSNSFQIYDEGIFSQETASSQPFDDDRILNDNIEAVKKELGSFLIDSLEKNSSELFDKENKENKSMCVDDSYMVVDSKDQSEDSVLDQSEISYTQQPGDFERLADYSESILPYMLSKERVHMPDPFYMNNQANVNNKMRSILVDWLVDVADEYNIKDETLFLAINYIDRFLSKISISRQEFQLLGTAALFIATKYEEIYPPEIGEFVYITDDSFNKLQILQMEKLILTVLEFNVSTPTANYFLEKYVSDLGLEPEVYCLSKYFCFLSALECSPFLKYYPSEIALCSILMASQILDQHIPELFMQKTYNYERSLGKNGDVSQLTNDRKALMEEFANMQAFAVEHQQQAIQRKFSTHKYYQVAKLMAESINQSSN